jgi:DNA-binding CsgD family transcriptional regulator
MATTTAPDVLTLREEQVLDLISEGRTNKEIAAKLGIAYETVKEHVQNLFRKLNVDDRTKAAVWKCRQRPTDEAKRMLLDARQFHVDSVARIDRMLEEMDGKKRKSA